jgi:hypothetical protein
VPLDCQAKVTVNRQELAYRARGIAERNLIVRGPAPLPENLLLSVEVAAEPPLRCWAVAKLSWPDAEGHMVLLQPFALDHEARGAWRALLEARLSCCGPLAEPVWAIAQEIVVEAEPPPGATPPLRLPPLFREPEPPPPGLFARLWTSLTSGSRTSPPRTESRRP